MQTNNIKETLKFVHFCLEEAKEHGLTVEVVTWALKFMKENPLLSIEEAINMGVNEWIK